MIDIYKASAGSGKTHKLTGEYLKILFSARDAYKHVLAVTFTNKATDEMKSRILEELYKLSSGGDSDYIQELSALYNKNPQEIREQAGLVLQSILHDYSLFWVSTIDRFFQSVMRAFARELGKVASYGVELNEEAVRTGALDMLYSELGDAGNDNLLKWMINFSLENVENGSRWDARKDILNLSKCLSSESFKIICRESGMDFEEIGYRERVESLKVNLNRIRRDFENKIGKYGAEGMTLVEHDGFTMGDYTEGATRSPFNVFRYMRDGLYSGEYLTRLHKVDDLSNDKWPSAAGKRRGLGFYQPLKDIMRDAIAYLEENETLYNTALLILDNINELGILGEVYRRMVKLCKDNNVMLLSETTELLNRIIDGNDTPFIYEKIGNRLDHLMLDEFQDTSKMQWENFRPLLAEIESRSGAENTKEGAVGNLVVGDIKQSIYRWRNSDWEILRSGFAKSFRADQFKEDTLNDNWRSCRKIIEFNNSFFRNLASKMQVNFDGDEGTISEIFRDVAQKFPKRHEKEQIAGERPEGYVECRFYDNPQEQCGSNLKATLDIIKDLLQRGYSAKDIMILVRRNNEGALVANYLVSNGIDVISNDSMLLCCCSAVRKVIDYLRLINNPQDVSLKISLLFEKMRMDAWDSQPQATTDLDAESCMKLKSMPLVELVQWIIHNCLNNEQKQDMAYLQSLMDIVLDYTVMEGGGLSAFIRWWDETSAKFSIAAPVRNAVSIMTIHKSKGLESKVVIVPLFYLPVDITPAFAPTIWCRTDNPKIGFNGPLPVKCTSRIKGTIFAKEYEKERLNNCIDALNMTYVSFTRPKNELYILAKETKRGGGISDYLYKFLKDEDRQLVTYSIREYNNTTEHLYCFGTKQNLAPARKAGVSALPDQDVTIVPNPQKYLAPLPEDSKRKRLKSVADSVNENGESLRNRGISLHYLFSLIKSEEDVSAALAEAQAQGQARDITEEDLYGYLSQVSNYGWFAKGTAAPAEVINECEILTSGGKILRPDRIVVWPDGSVTVVDYKFGEYKRDTEHEGGYVLAGYRKQVQGYMAQLRKMGYLNLSGYLWYPLASKIEKV